LCGMGLGAQCFGFPLLPPNNTALRMGHLGIVVLPTLPNCKKRPLSGLVSAFRISDELCFGLCATADRLPTESSAVDRVVRDGSWCTVFWFPTLSAERHGAKNGAPGDRGASHLANCKKRPLRFPFQAKCIASKVTSPLQKGRICRSPLRTARFGDQIEQIWVASYAFQMRIP
jgi:hypothetical protein